VIEFMREIPSVCRGVGAMGHGRGEEAVSKADKERDTVNCVCGEKVRRRKGRTLLDSLLSG
jgi:hypothetical protein